MLNIRESFEASEEELITFLELEGYRMKYGGSGKYFTSKYAPQIAGFFVNGFGVSIYGELNLYYLDHRGTINSLITIYTDNSKEEIDESTYNKIDGIIRQTFKPLLSATHKVKDSKTTKAWSLIMSKHTHIYSWVYKGKLKINSKNDFENFKLFIKKLEQTKGRLEAKYSSKGSHRKHKKL